MYVCIYICIYLFILHVCEHISICPSIRPSVRPSIQPASQPASQPSRHACSRTGIQTDRHRQTGRQPGRPGRVFGFLSLGTHLHWSVVREVFFLPLFFLWAPGRQGCTAPQQNRVADPSTATFFPKLLRNLRP